MEMLNHPKAETAHILFLDAVGYSTLPLDRQTAVFRGLQDIINNSPTMAEAASPRRSHPHTCISDQATIVS